MDTDVDKQLADDVKVIRQQTTFLLVVVLALIAIGFVVVLTSA
jgi:hypothetical protein